MNILKKTLLYLFGIGLILFGNRATFTELFQKTEKAEESPFGSINSSSSNQKSDTQSSTVIEPASKEEATATQ